MSILNQILDFLQETQWDVVSRMPVTVTVNTPDKGFRKRSLGGEARARIITVRKGKRDFIVECDLVKDQEGYDGLNADIRRFGFEVSMNELTRDFFEGPEFSRALGYSTSVELWEAEKNFKEQKTGKTVIDALLAKRDEYPHYGTW